MCSHQIQLSVTYYNKILLWRQEKTEDLLILKIYAYNFYVCAIKFWEQGKKEPTCYTQKNTKFYHTRCLPMNWTGTTNRHNKKVKNPNHVIILSSKTNNTTRPTLLLTVWLLNKYMLLWKTLRKTENIMYIFLTCRDMTFGFCWSERKSI